MTEAWSEVNIPGVKERQDRLRERILDVLTHLACVIDDLPRSLLILASSRGAIPSAIIIIHVGQAHCFEILVRGKYFVLRLARCVYGGPQYRLPFSVVNTKLPVSVPNTKLSFSGPQ